MRRKTILVLNGLAVLGLVCWLSRISFTQSTEQERIAGPIAGSPAVGLEGNRRPMFRPENDMGPVEGSFKLENISLMFRLTESQQADLTALLAEQQDPSSPNYHHWLTPEQYADRLGLSTNDMNQVVAWLQSQGFTIIQTARSRNWVSFSGTAAQVQAAFQTEIHNFSLNGQTYYGNATEPAVPGALADVALGIHGLDNYPLKPRGVFRQVAQGPRSGPAALRDGGPHPNFTSSISGNTFLAPGDFAIIYDVNALYNNGIDGTGQSIAVMGETDIVMSDITTFRSVSGLPAINLTVVVSGTDPGTSTNSEVIDEAALDIEWSGAVAPKAAIIYVNSTDAIFGSLKYAIDNNTAPVLSISYGACEQSWTSSDRQSLMTLGGQASSQGQTIVASSGDSGAADCDSSTSTTIVTSATQGLAVDLPAAFPFVTGMGGSEFNEGSGNYWAASTGVDVSPSALSYIPEMVWNDTSSSENTSKELLAGGGGASMYYSKPAWQTGTGVPNDNARDVPDLSLNASPIHDSYLICVEGRCVNGYRYTDQTLTVAGGTSAATPTFAGIVALINQSTNSRWGNINPTLYAMAGTSPAAFHDITTGNNMVPCTAGTTDCPNGGEIGYSAGVGYDQASGLGSIDAFNLVMEWNSSTSGNLPAPTLTAPANGATAVALPPTFTWTGVTGNNGYQIMIATSPAVLTTNPATSTCSACMVVDTSPTNSYTPPSALAAGTYFWEVQAIEPSSSSGHAAWSDIFSFTTTGGTLPAPTLSAPASGATAVLLPPTFIWTTVTGSAGYRILIAATQSALPTNPSAGTCGGCSVGTTTTAASYTPSATALEGATTYYWEVQALAPSGSGQNAFWSGVSSFTSGAPDFSLSASPSSLTINPGASGTSTLTLTPINNFTGSPTFTCSVASTLAAVTCSVGTLTNNTATVTITASSSATSYPALPRNPRFGEWWVGGVAMLCLLLIALSGLRQGGVQAHLWNLRQVALGAVLATLLVASLSCGGGSSGGTTTPPPESGTVTITGISTTTHTAQISVSVT
jgi:hypothetical protein